MNDLEKLTKVVKGLPSKQESSANVIDQVIGKVSAQEIITSDYKDKLAGSVAENPNWAGAAFVGDQLEKPDFFKTEVVQSRYDPLSALDKNCATVIANGAGLRPSMCLKIDVLEEVRKFLGEKYFLDQGAETKTHQIEVLNKIVIDFNVGSHAKGTGVEAGKNTNWCASKLWFDDVRWTTGTPQNVTGEIRRLSFTKDPTNLISRYLNGDGIMQLIVYGGLSDGTLSTRIDLDYADLKLTLDLSANDHIKKMIAHYCGPFIDQIADLTKRIEALEGQ